jgi:hypothetical protein
LYDNVRVRKDMKIILLGISIILFGIAYILVSGGSARTFGFDISFIGLVTSIIGCFIKDRK